MIDYISFILDFYSTSLISLEPMFICLSIDASFELGLLQLKYACRVSNFGAISITNSYKIDRTVWEMHAILSLGLDARVPTDHVSCAEIHRNLGHNEYLVGTCASIHSEKESEKVHIALKFPHNPI